MYGIYLSISEHSNSDDLFIQSRILAARAIRITGKGKKIGAGGKLAAISRNTE
jgi:hypothetical protein